jgi:hypothetical protein
MVLLASDYLLNNYAHFILHVFFHSLPVELPVEAPGTWLGRSVHGCHNPGLLIVGGIPAIEAAQSFPTGTPLSRTGKYCCALMVLLMSLVGQVFVHLLSTFSKMVTFSNSCQLKRFPKWWKQRVLWSVSLYRLPSKTCSKSVECMRCSWSAVASSSKQVVWLICR